MRHTAGTFLICCLFLVGCQKAVDFEKEDVIQGLSLKEYQIDAPKSEQKVNVSISSKSGPLSVHVVLEKHRPALVDSLEKQQKVTAPVLVSMEMQSGTLTPTIPAGEAYAVVVVNPKSTSVTVTVKIKGS